MLKFNKLFTTVLGISFIGTIPIGTLNASVTNYVLNRNIPGALWFGLGAILVEIFLVRLAMEMMERLVRFKKLFRLLGMVMCIGILMLAYKTLEAALNRMEIREVIPFVGGNPFLSGVLLSVINPLHLPFWMGWTTVLKRKGILGSTPMASNVYILAVGTGTALAFLVYGITGSALMELFTVQNIIVNWVLGLTLLATGILTAYKLIYTKIWLS